MLRHHVLVLILPRLSRIFQFPTGDLYLSVLSELARLDRPWRDSAHLSHQHRPKELEHPYGEVEPVTLLGSVEGSDC